MGKGRGENLGSVFVWQLGNKTVCVYRNNHLELTDNSADILFSELCPVLDPREVSFPVSLNQWTPVPTTSVSWPSSDLPFVTMTFLWPSLNCYHDNQMNVNQAIISPSPMYRYSSCVFSHVRRAHWSQPGELVGWVRIRSDDDRTGK